MAELHIVDISGMSETITGSTDGAVTGTTSWGTGTGTTLATFLASISSEGNWIELLVGTSATVLDGTADAITFPKQTRLKSSNPVSLTIKGCTFQSDGTNSYNLMLDATGGTVVLDETDVNTFDVYSGNLIVLATGKATYTYGAGQILSIPSIDNTFDNPEIFDFSNSLPHEMVNTVIQLGSTDDHDRFYSFGHVDSKHTFKTITPNTLGTITITDTSFLRETTFVLNECSITLRDSSFFNYDADISDTYLGSSSSTESYKIIFDPVNICSMYPRVDAPDNQIPDNIWNDSVPSTIDDTSIAEVYVPISGTYNMATTNEAFKSRIYLEYAGAVGLTGVTSSRNGVLVLTVRDGATLTLDTTTSVILDIETVGGAAGSATATSINIDGNGSASYALNVNKGTLNFDDTSSVVTTRNSVPCIIGSGTISGTANLIANYESGTYNMTTEKYYTATLTSDAGTYIFNNLQDDLTLTTSHAPVTISGSTFDQQVTFDGSGTYDVVSCTFNSNASDSFLFVKDSNTTLGFSTTTSIFNLDNITCKVSATDQSYSVSPTINLAPGIWDFTLNSHTERNNTLITITGDYTITNTISTNGLYLAGPGTIIGGTIYGPVEVMSADGISISGGTFISPEPSSDTTYIFTGSFDAIITESPTFILYAYESFQSYLYNGTVVTYQSATPKIYIHTDDPGVARNINFAAKRAVEIDVGIYLETVGSDTASNYTILGLDTLADDVLYIRVDSGRAAIIKDSIISRNMDIQNVIGTLQFDSCTIKAHSGSTNLISVNVATLWSFTGDGIIYLTTGQFVHNGNEPTEVSDETIMYMDQGSYNFASNRDAFELRENGYGIIVTGGDEFSLTNVGSPLTLICEEPVTLINNSSFNDQLTLKEIGNGGFAIYNTTFNMSGTTTQGTYAINLDGPSIRFETGVVFILSPTTYVSNVDVGSNNYTYPHSPIIKYNVAGTYNFLNYRSFEMYFGANLLLSNATYTFDALPYINNTMFITVLPDTVGTTISTGETNALSKIIMIKSYEDYTLSSFMYNDTSGATAMHFKQYVIDKTVTVTNCSFASSIIVNDSSLSAAAYLTFTDCILDFRNGYSLQTAGASRKSIITLQSSDADNSTSIYISGSSICNNNGNLELGTGDNGYIDLYLNAISDEYTTFDLTALNSNVSGILNTTYVDIYLTKSDTGDKHTISNSTTDLEYIINEADIVIGASTFTHDLKLTGLGNVTLTDNIYANNGAGITYAIDISGALYVVITGGSFGTISANATAIIHTASGHTGTLTLTSGSEPTIIYDPIDYTYSNGIYAEGTGDGVSTYLTLNAFTFTNYVATALGTYVYVPNMSSITTRVLQSDFYNAISALFVGDTPIYYRPVSGTDIKSDVAGSGVPVTSPYYTVLSNDKLYIAYGDATATSTGTLTMTSNEHFSSAPGTAFNAVFANGQLGAVRDGTTANNYNYTTGAISVDSTTHIASFEFHMSNNPQVYVGNIVMNFEVTGFTGSLFQYSITEEQTLTVQQAATTTVNETLPSGGTANITLSPPTLINCYIHPNPTANPAGDGNYLSLDYSKNGTSYANYADAFASPNSYLPAITGSGTLYVFPTTSSPYNSYYWTVITNTPYDAYYVAASTLGTIAKRVGTGSFTFTNTEDDSTITGISNSTVYAGYSTSVIGTTVNAGNWTFDNTTSKEIWVKRQFYMKNWFADDNVVFSVTAGTNAVSSNTLNGVYMLFSDSINGTYTPSRDFTLGALEDDQICYVKMSRTYTNIYSNTVVAASSVDVSCNVSSSDVTMFGEVIAPTDSVMTWTDTYPYILGVSFLDTTISPTNINDYTFNSTLSPLNVNISSSQANTYYAHVVAPTFFSADGTIGFSTITASVGESTLAGADFVTAPTDITTFGDSVRKAYSTFTLDQNSNNFVYGDSTWSFTIDSITVGGISKIFNGASTPTLGYEASWTETQDHTLSFSYDGVAAVLTPITSLQCSPTLELSTPASIVVGSPVYSMRNVGKEISLTMTSMPFDEATGNLVDTITAAFISVNNGGDPPSNTISAEGITYTTTANGSESKDTLLLDSIDAITPLFLRIAGLSDEIEHTDVYVYFDGVTGTTWKNLPTTAANAIKLWTPYTYIPASITSGTLIMGEWEIYPAYINDHMSLAFAYQSTIKGYLDGETLTGVWVDGPGS